MEIGWPGEKLLIKLWDTVTSKGIGSLLKPWQMRREGAAAAEIKRLNSLTIAQTKIEVSEIQSGRKVLLENGRLTPTEGMSAAVNHVELATRFEIIAELEEILEATVHKEALRKEVSVAKAILYAEQELKQETQSPTEAPVSDDWLLRWRDNAASVSSDELQGLWGKVLAGEVKSPGTFALRTLEFLRNISREDAMLIEKVAPFVLKNMIVRPSPDKQIGDLEFSEFMELQDLGVLSGVEGNGISTRMPSSDEDVFAKALTCHSRVLLISHVDKNRILELPIFLVTKLGQEVLSLGWKKADDGYLLSIGNTVKEMGYDVKIGSYVAAEDNMINCYDLEEI